MSLTHVIPVVTTTLLGVDNILVAELLLGFVVCVGVCVGVCVEAWRVLECVMACVRYGHFTIHVTIVGTFIAYGVAMVSRIDKIIGLFCRILSLL